MEELKCKVCGKLASEDSSFWKKAKLCNRHMLQWRTHGKFLDHDCIINPSRIHWTDEEIHEVEEMYKQGLSVAEMSKRLNKSGSSISGLATRQGFSQKYIKPNNPNFKAPYQDYDWCFERYVNKGMTHQEMADELGVTKRVIQKWCVEIHHIDSWTFQDLKHLSDIQRKIILVGTLGDGHIDKRPDQPMYIESHAIDEKDYLFWKYDYLKDLCNQPPVYYKENYCTFSSDKEYLCKPYYRINTRIINDLKEIRSMSRLDKIKTLDEFQLSILLLDDGNRANLWELCVAEWTTEEINELFNLFMKYKIRGKRLKDDRYIMFDALSSKRIDEMILKNIPNDLDIVKKKILNNNNIRRFKNAFYIIANEKKYGLATYCKAHGYSHDKAKDIVFQLNLDFNELTEAEFITLYNQVG